MSKHTPGPWYWVMGNLVHRDDVILDFGYGCCPEKYPSGDDMNLIAAAPDLLEALEVIVATEHERHGYNPFWTDQARAAIAKAKGEV